MADQARDIYRDYVTDGVPSSGVHNPRKAKIREWGTWVEGVIAGGSLSGAVWKATKTQLDGDLAHDAGTIGIVYDDATAANNGMYAKAGASGAGIWSQIYDHLPGYQFITATDDDNSTANAITADSAKPVPAGDGNALISLVIPVTNTSGTVTVSFNGGSALAVKTAAGNDPAIGGLVSGMTVLGMVAASGTQFRLASDQASAAIQAAAEAAQAGAETARDEAVAAAAKIPDVEAGDGGKFLLAKEDETGAEWTDVTHEVPSALSSAITAPKRIKGSQERYKLLDFGNARAEMAKAESLRDLQSAWNLALASGEKIYVPPGRYPLRTVAEEDTSGAMQKNNCIVLEADTAIDVECAEGATIVIPDDFDAGPDLFGNIFELKTSTVPTSMTSPLIPFSWRGGAFDCTGYTTEHGNRDTSGFAGLNIFNIFRYWMPTFEGIRALGGYTAHDGEQVGFGAMDAFINTHGTIGDRILNCTGSGFYDAFYYPSGAMVSDDLGTNPFSFTNGSPTVTVTWAGHGASVGDIVSFEGATAAAGLTISGQYAVQSVPTSDTLTITASGNASSTTTGGGSNVEATNVTSTQDLARNFTGIDAIIQGCNIHRVKNGITAKRGWIGMQCIGNRFWECERGYVDTEISTNPDTAGTKTIVSGNLFFQMQRTPVTLSGGFGSVVEKNIIEQFGKWLSDGTTFTDEKIAGISIDGTQGFAVVNNPIIRNYGTWAQGSPTAGKEPTGILIKKSSGFVLPPAQGIITGNAIKDVYQGINESDADGCFFSNLIEGETLASAYSDGSLVHAPDGATFKHVYYDDTNAVGPAIWTERISASPAANDYLGSVEFYGRNSAGERTAYAAIRSQIVDPTDSSEDGVLRFHTMVAGSSTARAYLGAGFYGSGMTDKGADSINFASVYQNGVALGGTTYSRTIASGAITIPTQLLPARIVVDTEASAASDDLDTISGGAAGQIIVIQTASGSRDVTVKHGTGNISLDSSTDETLGGSSKKLMLIFDGSSWYQVAPSSQV